MCCPLIVFHFLFITPSFTKKKTPPCPRSVPVIMLRDSTNTEYDGASDMSQISSPRVPRYQSPNASLLERTGLDDLEIFGTMDKPQARTMPTRPSHVLLKVRGPHIILPQTTMRHRDDHESDSQSTKGAHQPFCGCRFGAAFSETSKMVHHLTRRLNECGKEAYSHYTKKHHPYVAVPNDNIRKTAKNRVDEHTPLLSRPKQKQKLTRGPIATTVVQKRVLIPEVDIESLLNSAAKADWLVQDDIQRPLLTPQTKICSEPIDFSTGSSNALKIFVGPSHEQPIHLPPPPLPPPPPQTIGAELSSASSLEQRWSNQSPEERPEGNSHLTCEFADWNESDQVPIYQDQFNHARPRPQPYIVRDHPVCSTNTTEQCPQHPFHVNDSLSEECGQPKRRPSRLDRTKSRIRASLRSLPGFLPS